MAASFPAALRTENESIATVGGARRTPVNAARTFSLDIPHQPIPRTFVEVGGAWAELCGRCGGKGNVGYGPDNGVCYECNGSGHGARISEADLNRRISKWAARAVAESEKTERRIAGRDAQRQQWREENAELIAWAQGLRPSRVEYDADGYTKRAATREEAETPDGREEGEEFIRSQQLDTGEWWAFFRVNMPIFDQYGRKADPMIRRVRVGAALPAGETAYLTKVMQNAPAKDKERADRAAASRHAAPVGERLEISGTVLRAEPWRDGERMFITVAGTGSYQGITWKLWTGADAAWDLEKGQRVTVRATIKRHDEYRGVKEDVVTRPVFKVAEEDEEETPAAPQAPAEETAPQDAQKPAKSRASRRESQGEAAVAGWELLYDKPRAKAQVARRDGKYGLICTVHGTVTPLARMTDERKLRNEGGWCCH